MSKVVNGILTGVYENDKSDKIVIDGTTQIILKKGTGGPLKQLQGQSIQVLVLEKEFNGKTYLNVVNPERDITAMSTNNSKSTNETKSVGNTYQRFSPAERESIVFQKMAEVAARVLTANALVTKEVITDKQFLSKTYSLARLAMKPDLFRPKPETATNEASQQPQENEAI